jgi:hypothetical protein
MPTYYINADTGDNSTGDGSSSSPWETMTYAEPQASAGDTIICQTATTEYLWEADAFTKALTIQGESQPVYDKITQTWSGAIFSNDFAVQTTAGITWNLGNNDVAIKNLVFTEARGNWTSGLFAGSGDVVFEDCVFHNLDMQLNSSALGGLFQSTGNGASSTWIACSFYDFNFISGSKSVFNSRVDDDFLTLLACAFYNCEYITGALGSDRRLVTATNCIFYTSTPHDFAHLQSSTDTYNFNHNCLYNYTNTPTNTNGITSDPLFEDAANGDFDFQVGSPCVETGGPL